MERLLRAAMAAPSAGNQQPWQFIVVRDRARLSRSPSRSPTRKMRPSAPVGRSWSAATPAEAKWAVLWVEDCAAATENLLIDAEVLGLGAVWLGVQPLPEREEGCAGCSASRRRRAVRHRPLRLAEERKAPTDRFDAPPRALRALVVAGGLVAARLRLHPPVAEWKFVSLARAGTLPLDPCCGGRRPPAWRRRDRPRPTGRLPQGMSRSEGVGA